ncbi:hypothetical protein BO79DRAFT_56107 [Aspergillus costaricaensis CBS 115574]|uniref:Uncharacterized protein n=1 Tax=Aspergillus costaricaensis CBS 115574 TaxID=1448317 RepID=A0ACD1IRM6_9EURO|nr:hypothetical protein BO79DRAFT_56107 [Aspergillus costaricaensis CBS 115574]RAK92762.1 hypothetical protein BO79DRAFT_56107 [Aspergillus costaricaensis CBS 115574]
MTEDPFKRVRSRTATVYLSAKIVRDFSAGCLVCLYRIFYPFFFFFFLFFFFFFLVLRAPYQDNTDLKGVNLIVTYVFV